MLLDAIRERRSIRKYTGEPVPEEQIKEILAAAFLAPTASNRQEWRFAVVQDREKLAKMAEIHPYGKMIRDCAFSIIVGYEKGINDRFGECDCGAAIENMLLQAQSMGIGSVWCALMEGSEHAGGIKQVLGLPDSFATVAAVQFGMPAESKETPDRWADSKIIYIR